MVCLPLKMLASVLINAHIYPVPMKDIKEPLRLTNHGFRVKYPAQAEVAELADALRSGRSELTLVRVQIPPSAQDLHHSV